MSMHFTFLLDRLRGRLQTQVRNGMLTERGLARRVGLSQSHIHNVLSGARILTPSTADRILRELGMSILDLIEDEPGVGGEASPVRRPASRERSGGRSRALRRPSAPN